MKTKYPLFLTFWFLIAALLGGYFAWVLFPHIQYKHLPPLFLFLILPAVMMMLLKLFILREVDDGYTSLSIILSAVFMIASYVIFDRMDDGSFVSPSKVSDMKSFMLSFLFIAALLGHIAFSMASLIFIVTGLHRSIYKPGKQA